ncbi:MAG: type II toxin-antitoxin system mRNA interferase toxin, RelE/StbE family [Parcubacteria group bacterium CG_4_10_14_0_2_um_filter_41_6]|nr:MAG: type II toxin-antitoxin system mRNA interferase toxin, RelE/StbE family [Parcubacteria group bacterium CG22_combo_CG10-13_8_21_14_all_41_9]PIZ81761.1 MAG: type II toxin-antitoxin system mRNA interferase toxin, RelE/StbE family [Parcubacteria group bacterium CG_4_10_14_0_2_um_filter_41_6]
MNIIVHPSFKKAYKKRIINNKKLAQKVDERVILFQTDPFHPLLKNHALTGKKQDQRAISATGDYRIVYAPLSDNRALLLDVGTHNQVY